MPKWNSEKKGKAEIYREFGQRRDPPYLLPAEALFCEPFTCGYCNRVYYRLPELAGACPFCGMEGGFTYEKVMEWFMK